MSIITVPIELKPKDFSCRYSEMQDDLLFLTENLDLTAAKIGAAAGALLGGALSMAQNLSFLDSGKKIVACVSLFTVVSAAVPALTRIGVRDFQEGQKLREIRNAWMKNRPDADQLQSWVSAASWIGWLIVPSLLNTVDKEFEGGFLRGKGFCRELIGSFLGSKIGENLGSILYDAITRPVYEYKESEKKTQTFFVILS